MEVDEQIPNFTTPHEDIGAAFNAINAISEYDMGLCDEEERMILKEIKLMALYIIHIGMREIYKSNFYDTEEESA
jgi:hypothetical protein